jgi:hypothetical protein
VFHLVEVCGFFSLSIGGNGMEIFCVFFSINCIFNFASLSPKGNSLSDEVLQNFNDKATKIIFQVGEIVRFLDVVEKIYYIFDICFS